jgi:deoxyhypusine monooxygenase
VRAICDSMRDPSSALLRHEAAFVLGQLQDPQAARDLALVASDAGEAEMVRHEAAEALGALGTTEAQAALESIAADAANVVRESVEVALDIHEHETGGDVEFGLLHEVERQLAASGQ